MSCISYLIYVYILIDWLLVKINLHDRYLDILIIHVTKYTTNRYYKKA